MEKEKCVYGCGKEAKYTLKNGNKCCSKSWCKCPELKRKNSEGLKKAYENKIRLPLTHDNYRDKLAWNKGKTTFDDNRIKSKYKQSDIFCENSLVSKQLVRKKILELNLLPYKCQGENCIISNEWLGKIIILDLDHINGKNTDHRLDNLRFLCPNCHSQTPTFKNLKRKNTIKKGITDTQLLTKIKEGLNNNQIIKFFNVSFGSYYRLRKLRLKLEKEVNLLCLKCNEPVKTKSKSGFCVSCSKKAQRKIDRPSLEILENEVSLAGYSATGRKYGVSDNSIRKWIKNYKKNMHP